MNMLARVGGVAGMNSGEAGETSYANNSDFQRMIACVTKEERQDMAAALYRERRPTAMAIADIGCGTGPNALLMASDAVQAVLSECARLAVLEPPEFHVFLNDLPANDFNSVFRLLPVQQLHRCFVSAWPGSFYGRLFPPASLDYVVSSSSLHFLSKAPEMTTTMFGSSSAAAKENGRGVNKGRFYVSESSPAMVLDAYRLQFQSDFSLFLSCRAEEVRQGGLLILTFVARRTKLPSAHDCYLWDLLADALADMAAAGLVDEAKVDSFDAPFYGPCPEELRQVIHDEGSFALKRMDLFETSRRSSSSWDARSLAVETASTIRAVVEPMLGSHFGWDSVSMDGLFRRYRLLLDAYYRTNAGKLDALTNVFIALEKRYSY